MKSYRLSFTGLLIIALILTVFSVNATSFSGGSGTMDDPWHIATGLDLDNVRDYPDSHFIQVADVDLSAWGSWDPIEDFTGVFNGNYYQIENLYVDSSRTGYFGLFGSQSGTIIRVKIESGYILSSGMAGFITGDNSGTIMFSSSSGYVNSSDAAGGLAGINGGSIIESHTVSATITGSYNLGGITGINDGLIENSYSNANIEGLDVIGGFVGSNIGTVSNCYSTGSVTRLRGLLLPPPYDVGGLIGENTGIVDNSYYDSQTSGQSDTGKGEPRLTSEMTYPYDQYTYENWDMLFIWYPDGDGDNNGYPMQLTNLCCEPQGLFAGGSGTQISPYLIETSIHLNNVRAKLGSSNHSYYFRLEADINLEFDPLVAGAGWVPIGTINNPFLGSFYGNGNTIDNLMINRSGADYQGFFGAIKSGEILNLGLTNVNITGRDYTGAIAGKVEDTTIEKSYSSGSVIGRDYVGGIVGDNKDGDMNEKSIDMCFSYVQVRGRRDVGGLVGINRDATIKNSYAAGSVTGITGHNRVGGLVGSVKGHWWPPTPPNVEVYSRVHGSYSTGEVIGTTNTGGLIGYDYDVNVSMVTTSYWDITSSGENSSSGGTGKTPIQMLNPDTFTDWDFDDVWVFDYYNPYIRKHYPRLQWQGSSGAYNMNPNAHVKIYEDDIWHWEGFPRLETENDWAYTAGLLNQLIGQAQVTGIEFVETQGPGMTYGYGPPPTGWDPVNVVKFNKLSGYKFGFRSTPDNFMYVSGERVSPTVQYPDLEPIIENWVSYPLLETQDLLDAIDHIKDDVLYITGQDGGYYWDGQSWITANPPPNAYYGKMYVIELRGKSTIPFSWIITRGGNNEPFTRYPRPEYFSFRDKASYEEFIIEEIENDEGLLEIGAYVGEECIGATVFTGIYPFRILAYPDETHTGREISFVLHRGVRSGETERIRIVEARNNQTGKYERQVLQSKQQQYTQIRLGVGDYTETVITPQVVMGQNFPNPMVMGMSGGDSGQHRTESVVATNIPIYLSQDMNVDISVYNVKGQRVKTLTSGNLTAGKHTFIWNGRNEQNQPVGAGIYFYKLETDIETINKKMLIIR